MGGFAAVIMPLGSGNWTGAAELARDIVATFPGTRNTALDAAAGVVTFELHFPGNLSGIVRRLADRRIAIADTVKVSIAVASLVAEPVASSAAADERLVHGAEVWDPEFARGAYVVSAHVAGGRIEATIHPSSEAMHQLYDSMLTLAIVASDAPQATAGVR
jgi:hypothetical protein